MALRGQPVWVVHNCRGLLWLAVACCGLLWLVVACLGQLKAGLTRASIVSIPGSEAGPPLATSVFQKDSSPFVAVEVLDHTNLPSACSPTHPSLHAHGTQQVDHQIDLELRASVPAELLSALPIAGA